MFGDEDAYGNMEIDRLLPKHENVKSQSVIKNYLKAPYSREATVLLFILLIDASKCALKFPPLW
jgi:hypothetical protein